MNSTRYDRRQKETSPTLSSKLSEDELFENEKRERGRRKSTTTF